MYDAPALAGGLREFCDHSLVSVGYSIETDSVEERCLHCGATGYAPAYIDCRRCGSVSKHTLQKHTAFKAEMVSVSVDYECRRCGERERRAILMPIAFRPSSSNPRSST
jgi:ribosomal protein L37E